MAARRAIAGEEENQTRQEEKEESGKKSMRSLRATPTHYAVCSSFSVSAYIPIYIYTPGLTFSASLFLFCSTSFVLFDCLESVSSVLASPFLFVDIDRFP